MEKMNDLNDLLKHEIMDLYSAEEQIISALPAMIEKAKNPQLKKSLKEHLRITEQQRNRLDQVQRLLGQEEAEESRGLLSRLFRSRQTCRGMEGLIEEGNKVMKEDMDPDVMDAAIIACSQKIEHYEISGYGTARSFALQLGLHDVAELLNETLDEEYEADRLLTEMAESRINREASNGNNSRSGREGSRSTSRTKVEEPEMEMVSSGRTSSGRSGSSRSNSPSGSSGRGGSSATRSSGNAGGSAAARKTTAGKSASKSTSRATSGGRGSASGRGSSRKNS